MVNVVSNQSYLCSALGGTIKISVVSTYLYMMRCVAHLFRITTVVSNASESEVCLVNVQDWNTLGRNDCERSYDKL